MSSLLLHTLTKEITCQEPKICITISIFFLGLTLVLQIVEETPRYF